MSEVSSLMLKAKHFQNIFLIYHENCINMLRNIVEPELKLKAKTEILINIFTG